MRIQNVLLLAFAALLSSCASAPTTAVVQTSAVQSSKPALKYVRVKDFLIGDLAVDLPVLIPVPDVYQSVHLVKDSYGTVYWMRPDEIPSVEKTRDLPIQTGFMRGEISENVGYDENRNLFIGAEDPASLATAKSQFADLRLQRYSSNGYPVLLFQATISAEKKKKIYGAYVATKIDTNVVLISLRPPANSSEIGDFIWDSFGRSLRNGK